MGEAKQGRPCEVFERQRDDGLPVILVRFPAECEGQRRRRLDLEERARQVEQFALRWLHRNAVTASDRGVELDRGNSEAFRAPPPRELIGVGQHPVHDLARRREPALEVQHGPFLGHETSYTLAVIAIPPRGFCASVTATASGSMDSAAATSSRIRTANASQKCCSLRNLPR